MATGPDWFVQSASVFWILTLLLSESQSKKTQTYYMSSPADCNKQHHSVGGAVVYSHKARESADHYPHNVDCPFYFRAPRSNWKLMMRVLEMDIPDRTRKGVCKDALYVYDAPTYVTRAMPEAGGITGLCGTLLPPTLKSKGEYMTVVFKTDSDGPVGRGFKYIITAYSEDQEKYGTCGAHFECDNHLCIEQSLTCDGVDNCGDYSDEAGHGRARCKEECGFICKFLTLGVTASIFISVGSIVICLSCLLALICCLKRALCRKSQDSGTASTAAGSSGPVVTTATTVSIGGVGNGGGHSSSNGGSRVPSAFSNHGYSHAGYYPLQPVAYSPAHPPPNVIHQRTPHGSVYSSYAPNSQYHHHHHHHHHSAGTASDITQLTAHQPITAPPVSEYTNSSSSQGTASQGGASVPRPYTPPSSSKSGRSGRSNNSTSVTYSQGVDRVALPVHL
ncbi:hypothetical protein RRG08_051425 [Elysia crispata]|uniref:CUB domain-containing protein n=1 Tax=Elysia crispata TaxID=231223 RepID=A0AAE1B4T0_9GAST|nr:hypothetical protein RRG08_051425 [Elysia crispata]